MTENKKCGLVCPITGCPIGQILITTLIVGIVAFAFDWMVHGNLFKADYEATASLWRPQAEMEAMFPFCILFHGLFAFGTAALYCFFAKGACCGGKCPMTGVKFGLLLGLIVGIGHFSIYMMVPMTSMDLPIKWLIADIVRGVLMGYVLSLSLKKFGCCDKGACETSCSK